MIIKYFKRLFENLKSWGLLYSMVIILLSVVIYGWDYLLQSIGGSILLYALIIFCVILAFDSKKY